MSHVSLHLALSLALLAAAGCSTPRPDTPAGQAQLFRGMGRHVRPVTTENMEAQAYFDQALTWTYAFNHDEAIRSYSRAAELDPDCAMAWWGIALCNGPHINNPMMPEDRSAAAWDALQEARARIDKTSPVERALIEALSKRYAKPWPEDRTELDKAYAEAMAKVYAEYPDDSDVGTLYAESLMDLAPWNLYTLDGEPREGTDKIVAILARVREMDPDNPGAHHLFIHAVEPGKRPELALPAADALRDMVPASGHLTHMPSHIDVKVGQWDEAIVQNHRAMYSDVRYRRSAATPEFQHLYMSHNSHMLAFAAMMAGGETEALEAARRIWEDVPEDKLRENVVLLDPMMCAIYDVQKRFGRWDAILAEPPPPPYLPITNAVYRNARAIAYAAKKDFVSAQLEQEAFRRAVLRIPEDYVMVINPARTVLKIADHLLSAEIALHKGEMDIAVSELRAGIEVEDSLLYMEPPEWIQPLRHTLGAVLLAQQEYADAEKVYREDLDAWPNNGWSLYGLSRALSGQGRTKAALEVEERYERAWARADEMTESSCKCIPKT